MTPEEIIGHLDRLYPDARCELDHRNDYEMAVEFGGATMVRLGRVLFGERNYGGKV